MRPTRCEPARVAVTISSVDDVRRRQAAERARRRRETARRPRPARAASSVPAATGRRRVDAAASRRDARVRRRRRRRRRVCLPRGRRRSPRGARAQARRREALCASVRCCHEDGERNVNACAAAKRLASSGNAPRSSSRPASLAALAAVPAALAWTTLTGGVQNTVVPSMLVTQQGSELVSWDSPVGGTISIARNHGPAKVLVSGDPVGEPHAARAAAERRDPALLPERAGRRAPDVDRRRADVEREPCRRSRTRRAP